LNPATIANVRLSTIATVLLLLDIAVTNTSPAVSASQQPELLKSIICCVSVSYRKSADWEVGTVRLHQNENLKR